MRRPLTLLHDRDATSGTEFGLILPILMLMIAGLVEFGQIQRVYAVSNRLASQIATAWADCSDTPAGTCSTEMNTYVASATLGNVAPQLTTANVTIQMFWMQITPTTSTVTYSYPALASPTAAQVTNARNRFGSGNIVIVSVTYSHSLMFFGSWISTYLSGSLTPSYSFAQLRS